MPSVCLEGLGSCLDCLAITSAHLSVDLDVEGVRCVSLARGFVTARPVAGVSIILSLVLSMVVVLAVLSIAMVSLTVVSEESVLVADTRDAMGVLGSIALVSSGRVAFVEAFSV